MSSETKENQTRFVERSGLIAEREGFSRIAGRIFGLLMLSPTELSLEEIAERLHVSRASVSTEARRLQEHGILELTSRPGDRKDYYHIATEHYIRSVEQRFETMREFVALLDEGRRIESLPPETVERLDRCSWAFRDMMRQVSETLDRWRSGGVSPQGPAPSSAPAAAPSRSTTQR
jgi:DNA-binding transcriptional regulator GbsR (MarR family)